MNKIHSGYFAVAFNTSRTVSKGFNLTQLPIIKRWFVHSLTILILFTKEQLLLFGKCTENYFRWRSNDFWLMQYREET